MSLVSNILVSSGLCGNPVSYVPNKSNSIQSILDPVRWNGPSSQKITLLSRLGSKCQIKEYSPDQNVEKTLVRQTISIQSIL